MLKQCKIDDLVSGMILGRPVYEDDSKVLLEEGTVLTRKLIDSLLERPIFTVTIKVPKGEENIEGEETIEDEAVEGDETADADTDTDEGDEEADVEQAAEAAAAIPAIKVVPEKESVIDVSYIACYQSVYQALEGIFRQASRTGIVDTVLAAQVVAGQPMQELCHGMRAITQIHNMVRNGDYLLHHSVHVAILAGLMGSWMRMPRERRRKLILSGLLHDVGKLRISQDILNKPGKLTLTELKVVQRHPQTGYEMLLQGPLAEDEEVLSGVQQHHERNDGSGYPHGSKKAEIGDFGHILAILDIYDAMAANRSYAKKRSPFDVFDILSDDILSGRLDTEYGLLFIRQICHAMNGNWVRLSNGERGKIVYIDETRLSSLPVVQTMSGDFVDLNKQTEIRIECLLTNQEIES